MALYGIIAFIIYGWVEFEAMAHVVDAIGGLLAFVGIFVTATIGIHLLRSQSAIVMAQFRNDMAKGQVNSSAIASSVSLLFGAILMLIPGYVTDGLGLLCFIPGIRDIIGALIATRFRSGMMANASRFQKAAFKQEDFHLLPTNRMMIHHRHINHRHIDHIAPQCHLIDIIEGEFEEKINSRKTLTIIVA